MIIGITNLSAEKASQDERIAVLRSYWQIENGLHDRRVGLIHEVQTSFTKKIAAHTMRIVKNIVLGLIAQAGSRY